MICSIALMTTACNPNRSGLVRGVGYEIVPLPRSGARLLVANGHRRSVEVIASNNDQCKKDAGCLKPGSTND